MGWRVVVLVAVTSCVQTASVQCDGYICPRDTLCDTINGGCVLREQLVTCVGLVDGVDCTIAGAPIGFCRNGVCVESRCGDGVVRGSERCDGTNVDNQTCSSLGYYNPGAVSCTTDCLFDTSQCGGGKCGDHVVQADHEFCEDGVPPADLSCIDFGFDLGRLGCAPTCQPDFGVCEHFGFFPVVTNTSTGLRGLWGSSSTDLYIASDGAVRHFDGKDWTTIDLGTTATMFDVSGTSASDVWAVGDPNTIAHYDGTAWTTTTLTAPAAFYLLGVWAIAPDNAYAVGGSDDPAFPGTIAHWDGTAWTLTPSPVLLYDVWASGASDVYAVGEGGTVDHWDGTQWTTTTLGAGNYFSVWGSSSDDVWIGGQDLYHFAGGTWTQHPLAATTFVRSIAGAGGRTVFGINTGVLVDDAGTFSAIPATQFGSMWADAANDVWAVSPFGAVRRFTGRAWLDDGSTLTSAQSMSAASASYAVVANLAVPTTMQVWDGATWSTLPTCPINNVRAVWVAAPDDVFAVGGVGAMRYVADTMGGTPYWHGLAGSHGSLLSVWGRSGSDAFAVGTAGTIMRWNGSAWTQMTSNTTNQLQTVWGTATEVFAAGLGIIMHFDGASWTAMPLPPGNHNLFSIWGTATNNVYAGGSGEILHWDGTTWSVQAANVDSTLRSMAGNGPDDIYAVGSLGGMAHFDGVSWSPVRVPTTQNLFALAVTPTRVFVAGADGTQLLMLP